MSNCVICNGTRAIDSFEIEKLDDSSFRLIRKTKLCACQKQIAYFPTDEQITIEMLRMENGMLKQQLWERENHIN